MLTGFVAVGTTACGDDDAQTGEPKGLAAALASVPQSSAEETISYLDVPASRRLLARDKELYGNLYGLGIRELTLESSDPIGDKYGFTEEDVDTAVVIGADAQRLTGDFDVNTITQAMQKNGYAKGSIDGGALLKDSKGQVAISGTVRSSSYTDAAPPPLTPPSKSLADDPDYRAIADCLGDDVYAADFYGKRAESLKDGYVMFGFAATADNAGRSRERLCALTTSADSAQRIAGKLRTTAQEDKDFAGAEVTTGSGDTPMVTMEWKNHAGLPPGAQNETYQIPSLLMNL
ncbi:hypothetical protein [Streptomyces blattellae]|uniref:hypothetical protein n=1 Tax=Streptomyces blattellae TaxID=2569855 RepID=UPI0012B9BE46|nr:hypothetical protein [Streptomyces blattellae]